MSRRAGLLLHGVLAGVAVVGVALVLNGVETTAALVTLFLVTTTFVGQVDQVARHVPDLQAGMGAVVRLRQLLAAEREPVGGNELPDGVLSVELRHLHFAYPEGEFALRDVDLTVPAGATLALVGRSGSGKSTLASLLSRAVEPERGTVLLGGVDVLDLDLQQLRAAVGVVTQRTEILAGTLAENIAMFSDLPREQVRDAVDELGLTDWVAGLPDGLDTVLGPSGTALSAGEEQLVAFARLLVRHVRVVVLDEATARMDPVTEARVVAASQRLLAGRTGILVAHRLSTTGRAHYVGVMAAGRVVQQGPRAALALADGPFRDLLSAAGELPDHDAVPDDHAADQDAVETGATARTARQMTRTRGRSAPPAGWVRHRRPVRQGPARACPGASGTRCGSTRSGAWSASACSSSPCCAVGTARSPAGSGGTSSRGCRPARNRCTCWSLMVFSLLLSPILLAEAIGRYPQWWVAVLLRVRMSVLIGQTAQHRLPPTPPGEVVGRALDADRYARYADRWVDFVNGLIIAVVTGLVAGSVLAGAILLGVMVASAAVSALGSPVAGRSAAQASAARARFGRSLVSALDGIRTVKLAAATPHVHHHLRDVDEGRVDAAVREHSCRRCWPAFRSCWCRSASWRPGPCTSPAVGGWRPRCWSPASVNGFDWFGRVAGAVITEAPGTRSWQRQTSRFSGGRDLVELPPGLDLVSGVSPAALAGQHDELDRLELRGVHRRARRRHDRRERRQPRGPPRPARAAGRPDRLGQVQPAVGARRAGGPPRERCAGTGGRSRTPRRTCGLGASRTSRRCHACCPARSRTTSGWTTPSGTSSGPSRTPGSTATSRTPAARTHSSVTVASG